MVIGCTFLGQLVFIMAARVNTNPVLLYVAFPSRFDLSSNRPSSSPRRRRVLHIHTAFGKAVSSKFPSAVSGTWFERSKKCELIIVTENEQ